MACLACVQGRQPTDAAERARAVSAAKIKIADAARHVSQEAVQLHGGMGMSEELKVSHTFRRLTVHRAASSATPTTTSRASPRSDAKPARAARQPSERLGERGQLPHRGGAACRSRREGEVLVRNLWLSLDPYMRGRMSDAKSYVKGVELGEVMVGQTVGEVVESQQSEASRTATRC